MRELRSLRGWVLSVCLGLAVASPALRAAEPPSPSEPLPEVLINGERPGPGLWRVSKGDHDLWILATLVPLPKQMTWRSHAVETRIASSRVVLAPPEIVADLWFLRYGTYAGAVIRAERNPNRKTLKQVLGPDLYSRWRTLRDRYRYVSNFENERARPIMAANELFQHVVDESGLTTENSVWNAVEKIAHHQHVKILPVVIKLKLDSPEAWIREFSEIPSDQEIICFETTMERLETDLEPMRRRANLWSVGDVSGLLALPFPDESIACRDALFSLPRLQTQLAEAVARMENEWLAEADSALNDNENSFAVLPISQLLKPDGWLAKLRARGYSVQAPDGQE
jgi:TraB/PrgY/gumN family